ncbi:MAG: MBL fold metallo-hydrolase [Bacteroidetes bacterium]|nr:MBL fold metallo-hydrolase [Bacteroidota bacterium]
MAAAPLAIAARPGGMGLPDGSGADDEGVLSPSSRLEPGTWDPAVMTAGWVGHSTVLLNMFGSWVLTDPVFSVRVGLDIAGMMVIGPQRLVGPALAVDELPVLDFILISHAHMDHMDLPTLRKMDRSVPLVLPKNTADLVEGMGFETVYELGWGEWTEVGGVRVEAIEVNHIGWRYPWEPDKSRGFEYGRSYNAYLLSKNGRHVVFAGDTAYCEFFKPLRGRLGSVDLAILPIGGYDPWEQNHATPEQAVEMARHMGATRILPVHWHTFLSPTEALLEPIERLREAVKGTSLTIVLDTIGETWELRAGA